MKETILVLALLLAVWQNTFAQIDHWETALFADATWTYMPGENEPPADWRAIGFAAANWQTGPGGIGYGDGDDATVIAPVPSVYLRQSFEVTDMSRIELAVLHADYDDGFVAYLNGVEIARANLEGTPPTYDADANTWREALMYQGGLPEASLVGKNTLEQLLTEGENVLAVQVHNHGGTNSSDLTALFWLSFAINDNSTDYGPTPSWFFSPVFSSNLPLLKIGTGGEYIPDEPSIPGTMEIVWNGAGQSNTSIEPGNELSVNITIERRGQSSLDLFPKNGFAIETKDEFGEDMDVSFLNFPAEEDWVLHGPYSDKTLLRNVLAMHLANATGQYASRTRFVELLINDEYEGVYVIMEKIKRDESRVDIADLNEDDLAGDELTGGYVFKIDKGEPDWYSQFYPIGNNWEKLNFQYVSPKKSKIKPPQAAYIQAYVDSFEQAAYSPTLTFGGKRYDEYADLESFAEQFIIKELSRNVDAYRLSSYFHKEKDSKGGKIFAGPAWDFNLAWGNADYCTSPTTQGWIYFDNCALTNPFWWDVMLEDPEFLHLVQCKWKSLREGPFHLDSIFHFIDSQVELLGPAIERNYQRWPILNEYVWPNPVVVETYGEEIAIMKNWVAARVAWMDENLLDSCVVSLDFETKENVVLKIWPNPSSEHIRLYFGQKNNFVFDYKIIDVYGKNIVSGKNLPASSQVDIDLSDLPAGTYFCLVQVAGKTFAEPIILLK